MDSRHREELSDTGATKPACCLEASSLQLLTMAALSNHVLSCSLFSPDTFFSEISFFRQRDVKYPHMTWPDLPCFHAPKRKQRGDSGSEGWKEQKSRKARKKTKKKQQSLYLFGFHCAFWWSSHANVVLQMTIPAALRYNVPRGAGEFASTGLGGGDESRLGRCGSWSNQHSRCVLILG